MRIRWDESCTFLENLKNILENDVIATSSFVYLANGCKLTCVLIDWFVANRKRSVFVGKKNHNVVFGGWIWWCVVTWHGDCTLTLSVKDFSFFLKTRNGKTQRHLFLLLRGVCGQGRSSSTRGVRLSLYNIDPQNREKKKKKFSNNNNIKRKMMLYYSIQSQFHFFSLVRVVRSTDEFLFKNSHFSKSSTHTHIGSKHRAKKK